MTTDTTSAQASAVQELGADADPTGATSSTGPGSPPRERGTALVLASAAALTALVVVVAVGVETGPGSDGPAAPVPSEPADQVDEDGAQAPPADEDQEPATEEYVTGEVPEGSLSWAPPVLEDPEVVEITEDNRQLELDPERDYELRLPDDGPLEVEGGVTIVGGRNLVLVGGEIRVPDVGEDEGNAIRALYLKEQTGTVHIEGVALTGDGLGEGINLDQRLGAVVQLQNIRMGEVFGTVEGHHGDLVQTWAGPRRLLVDGLSGSTGYQGFFLLPQQFGDQPEPELFDLRRVDITAAEGGAGYFLWRDDASWPLETTDVHVVPTDLDRDRDDFLWDREGEDSWADVEVGPPPGGPFVPEGAAGVGYTTPGYRDQG